MDSIWGQLVSLGSDTWSAAGRSLWFAATSCAISILICFPLGSLIHFNNFRGKGLLVSVLQSLYCMPTVLIGLIVFSLLSRAGPLGELGWLFSPKAIIFGQALLISPIMMGLVISAYSGVDNSITETAVSLGASRLQMVLVAAREAKYAMLTLVIIGFSRAISELGISMMVGGNINFYTRTLATSIQLETQQGNLEKAWAMGILLLLIALVINIAIYSLQKSARLRKRRLLRRIPAIPQSRSG